MTNAAHGPEDRADERAESIRMLVESVAAVVPPDNDLRRIRALRYTYPGFDALVWKSMCEFGWPGIDLPEDKGGVALGVAALAALAVELGRGLVPEPLIPCATVAALLDGEPLARLLAGEVVLPAWQSDANALQPGQFDLRGEHLYGARRFIPYAGGATAFVVIGVKKAAWVAADDPGLHLQVDDTQDGGHYGTLSLDGARAQILTATPAQIECALERATVATAAYLLGLSERAFAMTLEYLKTRRQFGHPIGSFQALQHRAVDLKIQLALARASVFACATLLDRSQVGTQHPSAVSRAKTRANQVAILVTRQAVQLHGAIGYTDEYDLGLFLRKAMVAAAQYGSASLHRQRFGRHLRGELAAAS